MPRKSKVKYNPQGEVLYISHPDWDFIATASLRSDYADEIQSVTWSKNGDYLYSSTFECYLHVYIMKKWYGEDFYEAMKANDYVVDHMDNNGYNCCIENLCFLASDENKAKGMTVDKLSREKHTLPSLCLRTLIQSTFKYLYFLIIRLLRKLVLWIALP